MKPSKWKSHAEITLLLQGPQYAGNIATAQQGLKLPAAKFWARQLK